MLSRLAVTGKPGRPRAGAGALVCLLTAILAGCSPLYLMRAGWEEAKLLDRRRPLEAVVHDTTTPPGLRHRLRLVQDARDYAERVLGLRADDAFTSYAPVHRDTLLLVVSGAPRFRLRWKTWWFPVVGRLPYRGYFDFGDALAKARELENRGFDTYVRPAAAFSTLGWLPDPVLSTALRADSVALVGTVIHEITHTTYFPSGHADFGESVATFAGHAGAVHFFCRGLRDAGRCDRARHRWHDARRFGRWLRRLHHRLAELYARGLPPAEMARRKSETLSRAARTYRSRVVPGFRSRRYPRVDEEELNNAWLLARSLYYRRLDDFEALRRASGGLPSALKRLLRAARRTERPWDALDRLLSRRALLPATLPPRSTGAPRR